MLEQVLDNIAILSGTVAAISTGLMFISYSVITSTSLTVTRRLHRSVQIAFAGTIALFGVMSIALSAMASVSLQVNVVALPISDAIGVLFLLSSFMFCLALLGFSLFRMIPDIRSAIETRTTSVAKNVAAQTGRMVNEVIEREMEDAIKAKKASEQSSS